MTTAPIAVPDTTTIVAFEMTDGTSVSLGSKKGPSRGAKVLHKVSKRLGRIIRTVGMPWPLAIFANAFARSSAGLTCDPTLLRR
ncbi:hypothetical protein [Methylobacterium radiodurans]|uniref:hypothetical protein n=1 Tax=Methylobacterium radiodurans TaxID=2202828 RepID=UPI0013A57D4C|nr:hypothetical protein [Methylobacterium radiodurans]